MKSLVLLCGPVSRPLRLQTLREAGAEVVSLIPDSLPAAADSISVGIPPDWLPQGDAKTPHRKTWEKADTLALAAIAQRKLAADFYWVIESDCCASVERWAELFADWEGDPTGGVFYRPRSRQLTAWNPWWSETPAWAELTHLNAIYRLSREAVEACTAAAGEMREVFCEMTVGSVIQRAGLSVGSLNSRQTHCNCQTMKGLPDAVLLNRELLNHPLKTDTLGMENVYHTRASRGRPVIGKSD